MINNKNRQKGITLIALVVTIIILLILASISVATLNGDNSILKNAGNAKENSEISEETEIVQIATIQAMGNNKYGNVEKTEIENALKNKTDKKTRVINNGNNLVIEFIDTNRYYRIDIDGNIEKIEVEFDSTPGDFTKNQKGENLDGTEAKPYEISCIEDLCAYSNYIGSGSWRWSPRTYVILTKDLDFKSELSYVNGNIGIEGNIASCNSVEELMEAMTTDEGFYPITFTTGFCETFDGRHHKITNLYENRNETGLFGIVAGGTIQNLTVEGKFEGSGDSGGIHCKAGNHGSTIINCITNIDYSDFTFKPLTAVSGVGGIVGVTNSNRDVTKVLNCINYSNIKNGSGIIGWDWARSSQIYNCINASKVRYSFLKNIYDNDTIQMVNNLNYAECYSFEIGAVSKMLHNFNMEGTITEALPDGVIVYGKDYIQSLAYINEMNSYIENNDDGIDTTGWCKWILGDDNFPTLDFNTEWNGTEWVTAE